MFTPLNYAEVICFDVNDRTKNFARDTDQGSNWSLERNNKNHCMCLGAWSLYKARQNENQINRTSNELQCKSIPDTVFLDEYVGKYISTEWIKKNILRQSDDEIAEIQKQIAAEKASGEIEDEDLDLDI